MKFVVTGTGRSGTKFTKELLESCGLYMEWESAFFHDTSRLNLPERVKGMQEVGLDGEVSWMAVPWLHHPCMADIKKYHVVRNPLKQMASVLHHSGLANGGQLRNPQDKPYHEYTLRHIPEMRGVQPRVARMMHYVIWNMWAEECADKTFRLEDQMLELCEEVGVTPDDDNPLLHVKHHNRFRPGEPPTLDWDFFPDGEWKDLCKQMAGRYGYDV